MKRPAILLAAVLLLISGGLVAYRILVLDYPALPASTGVAWNLTMEATVEGEAGKDIRIELALPGDGGAYAVSEERIESGLLAFDLVREGDRRFGVWSGSAGEEFISYRAVLVPVARAKPREAPAERAQLTRLLPLTAEGLPVIRVVNGRVSDASWDLAPEVIGKWRLLYERVRTSARFLDRWSLFHLPEKFQETFRILLLVPIGALMVCVLRNVIGFPTFGIFMPVLMALAFRSTGLAYGLTIFAGVAVIGYAVRRGVDRLRLLLVPRLSLILTLVVGLFTVIALAGGHRNQRELMAVGLIPFVILTMTIERLYVILEEAGVREALRTAAGSAAVATITYELIHWESLQLAFFVYPELLLAVAAAQVLIGRYTGYRLSELIRFRALGGSP
ncbi:MAG: hypothetical protein OHK0026_10610 [Rhodocyclaceae bacterium]